MYRSSDQKPSIQKERQNDNRNNKHRNDSINFFIVSIDCFEKLELTYLKQLASDYLKLKCAHRDLGSAMVIDYTEADFSDLRKIRTKVWNNAQKVLHEIVVTMKQYQSCNESETAGGNSLPICGKR